MHACKLDQPVFVGATEFEFEETEDGFFVHHFVISNKVNANNWMVTSDANRLDGKDFEGKPDIVFINEKGQRDHTTGRTKEESLKVQEPFRKGTIKKIKGTDTGRKLTSSALIEDEDTKAKIRSGEIKFVSPAIFPKSLEDVEIVKTGPNTHIHIVHRYNALHVAFVDDPAYGIEAAVGPTCEGNGKDCLIKLQQIQAGIGDDEVDPLREIKLVKIKTSKCSKTGNLIFEMPAGELSEEVSKCLSQKLSPGEEPTDQDLAICFDEAREKLKKSKAKESKQATTNSNKDEKYSSNSKMTLTDEERDEKIKTLESKAQEVEKELKVARKAQEEEKKEKEAQEQEDKDKQAQEDEDKKEGKKGRKGRKGQDEMTEDEKKEEAKRAQEEEKKKEDEMTAKIAKELSVKIPLVKEYVAAKVDQKGLDAKAAKELEDKMLNASVEEIQEKLDDIGTFAAMKKSQDGLESPVGYGANTGYVASKYEDMSDADLEKAAEIDA